MQDPDLYRAPSDGRFHSPDSVLRSGDLRPYGYACSWAGAPTRADRSTAGVAQLAEHLFCKQAVGGSSPFASSPLLAGGHPAGPPAVGTVEVGLAQSRGGVLPAGAVRLAGLTVLRAVGARTERGGSAVRSSLEGCPSGQREQAVNLPAYAYGGSNPPPSTLLFSRGRPNPREVLFSPGRPNPREVLFSRGRPNPRGCSTVHGVFAGVAQLVERQPSKLNVEGSNPFSRSVLLERGHPPGPPAIVLGGGGAGDPKESRRVWPREPSARFAPMFRSAHLAQLVERVLGKDEVTSSILVVGSTARHGASARRKPETAL